MNTEIRTWRTKRGIRQEAVAIAANVSLRTVQNWESGQQSPRLDQCARIDVRYPGFTRAARAQIGATS